jgi:hypothetical protein
MNATILILWGFYASHNKELNLSAKKFKQTINQIVNAVSINGKKFNQYIKFSLLIFFIHMLCF